MEGDSLVYRMTRRDAFFISKDADDRMSTMVNSGDGNFLYWRCASVWPDVIFGCLFNFVE